MFKKIKRGLECLILTSVIGLTSCASNKLILPKPIYSDPNSDHRKVIAEVNTFDEAKDYCLNYLEYLGDKEQYGKECWVSFKRIHYSGKDDCDGGAVAAGALLSDDGYPLTIVGMYGKEVGHTVFLFKENGKYGSLGINDCDCNTARFNSVDDLVKYLNTELFIAKINGYESLGTNPFEYYYILDFSKYVSEFIEADYFLDQIIDYVKKDSEVHYLK